MADFPARENALGQVLGYAEQRCTDLGLPYDVGLRAALIVEELFVNTVHYGQCEGRPVRLELELSGGELELRYEDSGRPFDPFSQLARAAHERPVEERPVGGLGVVLIDGFCRRCEYQRAEERNQLRLWMAVGE